jgi:hypothetical protein
MWICPCETHEGVCSNKGICILIFKLGTRWGERSTAPSYRFPLEERLPRYPLNVKLDMLKNQAEHWRRNKSCPYRQLNHDSSNLQPAAYCYTNCASPAPVFLLMLQMMKWGAGMASSIQQIATGWTVGGSITCGSKRFLFSAPIHIGHGAQPDSCKLGSGSSYLR